MGKIFSKNERVISAYLKNPRTLHLGDIVFDSKDEDYPFKTRLASLLAEESKEKLADVVSGKHVDEAKLGDKEIDRLVENFAGFDLDAHIGPVEAEASIKARKKELLKLRLTKCMKYSVDVEVLKSVLKASKFLPDKVGKSYIFIQSFVISNTLQAEAMEVVDVNGKLVIKGLPVAGGGIEAGHEVSDFKKTNGTGLAYWLLLCRLTISSEAELDVRSEGVAQGEYDGNGHKFRCSNAVDPEEIESEEYLLK